MASGARVAVEAPRGGSGRVTFELGTRSCRNCHPLDGSHRHLTYQASDFELSTPGAAAFRWTERRTPRLRWASESQLEIVTGRSCDSGRSLLRNRRRCDPNTAERIGRGAKRFPGQGPMTGQGSSTGDRLTDTGGEAAHPSQAARFPSELLAVESELIPDTPGLMRRRSGTYGL